jgi:BirA family biotin operon repressor/biotin-[acetyl-CoA-carboxylase] ligase
LGGAVAPEVFAPLIAASFARLLGLWRASGGPALAQAWERRAHPLGTRLTVHAGHDETISGRFEGLEPDGALRLRLDDGKLDVVRAGDVDLA